MSSNVLVETKNGVCWIRLKREHKKNALTSEMYDVLISALDEANTDDDVILTVITGSGDYYSSGNDFSPKEMMGVFSKTATPGYYFPYKIWVDKLIVHKKPVIALVNGPALGVAVTSLALCDAIFASDKAYFKCPFTELGVVPEACSSYTFVQIMGHQKAAKMALFAEKMTAQEAYTAGFVTKIIPHDKFEEEMRKIVEGYAKLGKQSLLVSKKLLRPPEMVEKLLSVNRIEYEAVIDLFNTEDTMARFTSRFGKARL